MHFLAVLNRDGGTLRGMDPEALARTISSGLEQAGHTADVHLARGAGTAAILKKAAQAPADAIMVGGGDGTVSTAAAALAGTDKALAILPAGTMNLFARSLGIPLALDAAVEALAHGTIRNVDIGSVDGRPFVHQFSIGLHARLVQLRSRLGYGSRLGKLRASVVAAFEAMRSPPLMRVVLDMGDTEVSAVTTGVGISNNLFGEGHLPYADEPNGGILGIYVSSAMNRFEILWLFASMALGRWQANQNIEIHQTEAVTLTVAPGRRPHVCVIDGELAELAPKTTVRICPGALKVVVPRFTPERAMPETFLARLWAGLHLARRGIGRDRRAVDFHDDPDEQRQRQSPDEDQQNLTSPSSLFGPFGPNVSIHDLPSH